MQGMKKTLVALLAVAMVLSLVAPVLAAPADVAGTKYEDAAVRLIALGVFKGDDKGNFNPGAVISRAEATAVIVRALGLEKSAELMNGVTKFPDVNADAGLQWATGAINVAVSSGIVNGYPNGQFGGRDNVTFAQLAKMVLYALNYGVTVEGGVWPTAVLAKADDLRILKGLSIVADAPITRGDAAKMLDNSLDVKSLKQEGYGALQTYKDDGQTLLEKMGLDELEGQVEETVLVNTKFKANELKLNVEVENGKKIAKDPRRLALVSGNAEALLGFNVKAWVNKDDEIVFVDVATNESDILYDSVSAVTATQVELRDNDEFYLAAKAAPAAFDALINFGRDSSLKKASDLVADDYGVFVLKDKEISHINAFHFEKKQGGIVTAADSKTIEYLLTDNNAKKLRVSSFKNVYVYGPKLNEIELGDIEEDDIVYWFADGTDDLFIVVASKALEGELERVYNDKVVIDGKTYKTVTNSTTISSDNDDHVGIYYDGTTRASAAKDLVGKDVVALLDLNGRVRHLRGEAKAVSGWIFGVVTNAFYDRDSLALKIVTEDGEKVTYSLAKESNWTGVGAVTKTTQFAGSDFYAVAYQLNADGDIAKDKLEVLADKTGAIVPAFDGKAVVCDDVVKADDDDDLFYTGAGLSTVRHYVGSSAIFMKVYDSDNDIEPAVVKWADLADKELVVGDNSKAIVVGDANRDAKFALFIETGFQAITPDVFYGVAVSDVSNDGDDDLVTIDVFGKGQAEYIVPTEEITKGDLVAFQLSGSNELKKLSVTDVNKAPGAAFGNASANVKYYPSTLGAADKRPAFYDEIQTVDGVYVSLTSGADVKMDREAVVYWLKSGYKFDKAGDYMDFDVDVTVV